MIHLLTSKYGLSEYLFSDLEGIDTIFVPVHKHNLLRHRIVKAIYYKVCSNVYSDCYNKNISEKLHNISPDDTLIVIEEDTYNFWVLSHLCKHVKNKVAYFWNPCVSVENQKTCRQLQKTEDRAKAIVEYIRNLGFTMATFDSSDAVKYNMYYYPQFYRSYPEQTELTEKYDYDFYFCGRDKGRKTLIDFFQKRLSKFGKCKFIIIPESNPDFMGYYDYIDEVKKAKVLCEIGQKGQTGLTIRALEALFFNKKMITTNEYVKQMDFYNPANILVLNQDTTDSEIEMFLNVRFQKYESGILAKYDVKSMLESLSVAYVKK